MKIYDCFTYFNEDLVLKLRFETLWDFVDYFVICEANFTHAGLEKSFFFDSVLFEKYMSKVIYLKMTEKPANWKSSWDLENAQRNFLINGLDKASPEDWVIISDLDEIPNPENIKKYSPKLFLRGDFEQTYFSYFFNNRRLSNNVDSEYWYGSKITTMKFLREFFKDKPNAVRNFKSFGIFRAIKRWWFKNRCVQIIRDGGWHFTWILKINDLIKKIESTAHTEMNTPNIKNKDLIIKAIKSGRDFYNPHSFYSKVPLDDSLPIYLAAHPDEFQDYLI